VYTPDAVYSVEFQMYGSSFEQIETEAELADGELMVKFNVATESQPTEFVVVKVFTPLVVYVTPFHVNELHADSVADDVVGCLMVKFNVATESQFTEFVVLNVYVPLVVYVVPFHK